MLKTLEKSEAARKAMVKNQIAARGITDSYVLAAMETVPREHFMPEDVAEYAYDDTPAPIGKGQTISQPYIVALMAELANLHPMDKVLEIGTGSGYGAAVLSQIVDHVYTIERHPSLTKQARRRLAEIGYENVEVMQGDGSIGHASDAPYDAIIVTAGAPDVPEALKAQLEIGGRLIIPVGREARRQHMMRITRISDVRFKAEDFGPVMFVPLVGEEGWPDPEAGKGRGASDEKMPSRSFFEGLLQGKKEKSETVRLLEAAAVKLPAPDSPHFGKAFDKLAEADVVLLGEATHGTAEFYRARAAITQRLVSAHGFNIVAFEADWPDMAVVDGFVRERKVPDIKMQPFARFPEWMWRNTEFALFAEWMKKFNARKKDVVEKVGFYGLDLYGLEASINAVISFLEERDRDLAETARRRYACFQPWLDDPVNYGITEITSRYQNCRDPAVNMMLDLMEKRFNGSSGYPDAGLDLMRNAIAVAEAEEYYRAIYTSETSSWNLRDRHMFNTLQAVMKARGKGAKAVVWAHNSHIGDARATDMGVIREEINLGQLCREFYGDKAALVGFGTASGTVMAASEWGGKEGVKTVRTPLPGSHESLWHESELDCAMLDFTSTLDGRLQKALGESLLQRAIGVIYRPQSERISHYYNARPIRQYDHYIWFEDTSALIPTAHVKEESGEDDMFPFGV